MVDQLPDGLYFGLPDEVYHQQQRLSTSGIKNLLVSPMNFWATSWLNPNARGDDDDEPEWAIKGKAYHSRICEGKAVFNARYVVEIVPQDYPGALVKSDDLKNECKKLGLPVSGTKDVLSERLRSFGCQNLWVDIEQKYADANKGKTLIRREWLYDIEIGAACIEKHPTLSKCFIGGYPEVSVFWTAEIEVYDEATNDLSTVKIPMKCRMDFLKPGAITDLKTFANQQKKPIERAVFYDIAVRKYHIQAAVYYQGADAAAQFIKDDNVTVIGERPPEAWLKKCAETEKTFVFVHSQKGVAPVAVGNVMPRHLGLVSVGKAQVEESMRLYHKCMKQFGSDPWIMDRPMNEIDDMQIPGFATE